MVAQNYLVPITWADEQLIQTVCVIRGKIDNINEAVNRK